MQIVKILCFLVPPKEMLVSLSIGTFLTNYDIYRKLQKPLIHSSVRKQTKKRVELTNGDYFLSFFLKNRKVVRFYGISSRTEHAGKVVFTKILKLQVW